MSPLVRNRRWVPRSSRFHWTRSRRPAGRQPSLPSPDQCPHTPRVLRPSCPGDKHLTGPLEALPSTEELCQRGSSQSVGRDRGEQNEDCLALSDVDVLRLVDKPEMPAKRSPLVLRHLSVGQQERELEGFCQADELELRRGRQRIAGVPVIERSAEAHVGRALRHEQMFPWPSTCSVPWGCLSGFIREALDGERPADRGLSFNGAAGREAPLGVEVAGARATLSQNEPGGLEVPGSNPGPD
jgi:hypothetical protein